VVGSDGWAECITGGIVCPQLISVLTRPGYVVLSSLLCRESNVLIYSFLSLFVHEIKPARVVQAGPGLDFPDS
jgi:hypothetical protein